MNPNDFSKLKNDPALRLSEGERALMRAELLTLTRTMPAATPSSFAFFMHIPALALAFLLIISTGTVSFAAEGALPGEALYAIKVGVNEQVEELLAPGTEAKANVAVRHAEERIREAEVLAAEGKLDDAVMTRAVQELEEHVEKASTRARVLADAGDTNASREIHARIGATLAAHAELIEAQAENLEEEPAERLRTISTAIALAADDASAREGVAEETDEGDVRTYARATYARAKERIQELEDRIEEDDVPQETLDELSAEHERLSGEFSMNEELIEADDAVNATDAYASIEKRAVRAITLMKAARDIARETDKEVVISFDGSEPAEDAQTAATRVQAKAAPASLPATLSLEASTTHEESDEEQEQEEEIEHDEFRAERSWPSLREGRLKFWIRDRSHD